MFIELNSKDRPCFVNLDLVPLVEVWENSIIFHSINKEQKVTISDIDPEQILKVAEILRGVR